MKCIKNKKGFTLVELLVTITIFGIIMVIALPQLSNIQSQNQKTKYKKYAQSLVTSAKLYTDSYAEDMFGNNTSGCIDVRYGEIKDKGLVKDIKIDGSTCALNETFIRVRKANNHYFYEPNVICKDKNGNTIYSELALSGPTCDEGPDQDGPQIILSKTPNINDDVWTKGNGHTATIKVWDSYGMLENTQVRIDWYKDGVPYSTENYDFKNKRYEANTDSTALNYTFEVPQNATGIFVMTVTPINVRDSIGNYANPTPKSLTFKLDNTAPTLPTTNMYKWSGATAPSSHSGLVSYTSGSWSNINIYAVAAGSTDDRSTVSYQYNTTGTTGTSTDQAGNSTNIGAQGESTIQFRACDEAGNCSNYNTLSTIKLDKTSPTITSIDNPSNGNVTLPMLKITYNGYDNQGGSGIAGWQYTYDINAGWNSIANSNTSPYVDNYTWETNRDVYIRLCDNADNCSAHSSTRINISKCAETEKVCGDWSGCSATCGGGKKTRSCQNYSKYDASVACGNAFTEEGTCNEDACPSKTCRKSRIKSSSKSCNSTYYNNPSSSCDSGWYYSHTGCSRTDAGTYTATWKMCWVDPTIPAHVWRDPPYPYSKTTIETQCTKEIYGECSSQDDDGIPRIYSCSKNYNYSGKVWCFKYNTCSTGTANGNYCYLYNQTSCQSGWEEVK